METLFKDLRFAIRSLRKRPGFTAVVVLTLALGIGANTAIFSVVYSVLINPLPFHRPDRIVLLWGDDRDENDSRSQVSHTDIVDYRAQQTLFDSISTFNSWNPLISGSGEPARIRGALVGDDFFRVMGEQPFLGRAFLPEEQQDGKDQVVVLSHELWQKQLNSDPNAIGKTILLNLRPHIIVGVMPASFHSLPATLIDKPALLYRPVAEETSEEQRSARHLRAIGRLKDGVTVAQAQSELTTIARRLETQHPEHNTNWGIHLVGLQDDTVRDLQKNAVAAVWRSCICSAHSLRQRRQSHARTLDLASSGNEHTHCFGSIALEIVAADVDREFAAGFHGRCGWTAARYLEHRPAESTG
jgi:putative ABC transport system permease protein